MIDKVLGEALRAAAHGGQLMVDVLAKEFGPLRTSSALPAVRSARGQKLGVFPLGRRGAFGI